MTTLLYVLAYLAFIVAVVVAASVILGRPGPDLIRSVTRRDPKETP